jgi:DNA-binding XRE family transcriptional regulator
MYARRDSFNTTRYQESKKMKESKRKRLEASGWRVGSTKEFLNLSDQELEYIEIKLALSQKVRELRLEKKMTQEQTAKLLGSSQSRVAKIEAGDPSVSIDLQVKSLIALGASRDELAEVLSDKAAA